MTTISSNFFNCTSITASKAVPAAHQIHHPLPCFSICPIVPSPPPTASPETPPLIVQEPTLIGKIANLFDIVWDEPPHLMSMIEAMDQNKPPFVAYWLQKNDRELANHIDEYALNHGLCATITGNKVFASLAKHAENGNIPLVLMYLDRVNQLEMGIEWAAAKVFENAVKGGQLDLILAVLRRGYPVDYTKTFLLKEAA